MIEGIAELIAHLGAGFAEWADEDRRKEPRMEECLRCGASHTGVRCPECGYVFRVRKSTPTLPPLSGDEPSD